MGQAFNALTLLALACCALALAPTARVSAARLLRQAPTYNQVQCIGRWRPREESVSQGRLSSRAYIQLDITLSLQASQRFGLWLYQAVDARGNLHVEDNPDSTLGPILGDHSVSLLPSNQEFGNDNLIKHDDAKTPAGLPQVFSSEGTGFTITNTNWYWKVLFDDPYWYLFNSDPYASGYALFEPKSQRVTCTYSNV